MWKGRQWTQPILANRCCGCQVPEIDPTATAGKMPLLRANQPLQWFSDDRTLQ
jgi:hypothetical protein